MLRQHYTKPVKNVTTYIEFVDVHPSIEGISEGAARVLMREKDPVVQAKVIESIGKDFVATSNTIMIKITITHTINSSIFSLFCVGACCSFIVSHGSLIYALLSSLHPLLIIGWWIYVLIPVLLRGAIDMNYSRMLRLENYQV